MRVLAATDKFKGTATASEIADAISRACAAAGHTCTTLPLADGGEGILDVFGGPNRHTTVTGPLGDPVRAAWRLDRQRAVIEMAQASGLALIGGPDHNDPIAASTAGVGELIEAALAAGARRIIVGLGGSATTDGGFGALRALAGPGRLRGVDLEIACDVTTTFVDAAEVFAPQKGATPAQVRLLHGRLERLAQMYREEYGVEVGEIPGSGAAGGLAGGLMALGGRIVSGFDLVAEEVGFTEHLDTADLVITGEGMVDPTSTEGKVVGAVVAAAAVQGKPVIVLTGSVEAGFDPSRELAAPLTDVAPTFSLSVISLAEQFGLDASLADPAGCIETFLTQLWS